MPLLVLGVINGMATDRHSPRFEKFHGRYFGAFSSNLDKSNRWSAFFAINFVYRRLFLALAIVYLYFESAVSWMVIVVFHQCT